MKKSIGVIILIIGLAVAGYGLFQQQNNTKTLVKLGKTEIKTKKESEETNLFLIVGGVLALSGLAISIFSKK